MTSSNPAAFDLDAAKKKAREKSDEDLTLALGGAGNALDGILEKLFGNADLDAAQKTAAYQAIAANASAIVDAAMNGTSGPAALGGGSTGSSSSHTDEEYDELEEEKEAAEAQNRVLNGDRRILESIVLDLQLTAPADSNTPFSSDTRQRVKDAIAAKEQAAKDSVVPEDSVAKAEVKVEVDKLKAAWSTARPARMDSDKTVVDLPQNKTKIDESLTALDALVG